MLYAALPVALLSLWMAWPGLRRPETSSTLGFALRWALFGMLCGSALLVLTLLLTR